MVTRVLAVVDVAAVMLVAGVSPASGPTVKCGGSSSKLRAMLAYPCSANPGRDSVSPRTSSI